MKRTIGFLLVLALCVSFFPAGAILAADTDESNFVIEDGELTGYNGPGGKVTVPDGVTVIRRSAFNGNTQITEVELPDTVEEIDVVAFKGCRNLKQIHLSDRLTEIKNETFYNCTALTSIKIPERVTSIGNRAFLYCTSLAEVVLPPNLTTIGTEAFGVCLNLPQIDFPPSVTSIGSLAFESCQALTNVILPPKVTTLDSTFYNCISLTNIELPPNLTALRGDVFMKCTSLQSIVIPTTVTDFTNNSQDDLFEDCPNLKTMSVAPSNLSSKKDLIPSSVETLYFRGTWTEYYSLEWQGVTFPSKTYCLPTSYGSVLGTWQNDSGYALVTNIEIGSSEPFMIDCGEGVTPPNDPEETVLRIQRGKLTEVKAPDALPMKLDVAVEPEEENAIFVWSGTRWLTSSLSTFATVTCASDAPEDAWYKDVYCANSIQSRKNPFQLSTETQLGFSIQASDPLPNAVSLDAPQALTYTVSPGSVKPSPGDTDVTLKWKAASANSSVEGAEAECVIPIMAVFLDQDGLTLATEETDTLTAKLSHVEPDSVVWKSSDPSVATVAAVSIDDDGTAKATVTGVGKGTATITATAGDCMAQCTVTVTQEPTIALSRTSMELYEDQSQNIKAAVVPSDTSVTWVSSDANVAAVSVDDEDSRNVTVTGKKRGTATITATATNEDGTIEAACEVTVNAPTIILSSGSMTLFEGRSGMLTATVTPADADVSVDWSSSDPDIAAVSGSGLTAELTANAVGSVTITATMTSQAGTIVSDQCTVIVKAPTISLNPTTLTLCKGEEGTLTATPEPEGSTVSWSSSNTKVAAISGNGTTVTISALSLGDATITVQAGSAAATCKVTVVSTSPPTSTPTSRPTTALPTTDPSDEPSEEPSEKPSENPSEEPTEEPADTPPSASSAKPTGEPSRNPSPGATESERPTSRPTARPTYLPGASPSASASSGTSSAPSSSASASSTTASPGAPSAKPTQNVSPRPSALPGPTDSIGGGMVSVTDPDSGYAFEVTDSFTAIEGTTGAYNPEDCADVAQILSELTIPEGTLVISRDADGERISDNTMACTGQTITFLDGTSGKEIVSIVVVVKGDVNGDGVVNIVDVVCAAQAVNGERNLEGPYFLAADMTENGTIDIADVVQIARIITSA